MTTNAKDTATRQVFNKVMTKGKANKAMVESLFFQGGTLGPETIKYCSSKYENNLTGRDLGFDSPVPIWCERRKDKDGPYYVLVTFRRG